MEKQLDSDTRGYLPRLLTSTNILLFAGIHRRIHNVSLTRPFPHHREQIGHVLLLMIGRLETDIRDEYSSSLLYMYKVLQLGRVPDLLPVSTVLMNEPTLSAVYQFVYPAMFSGGKMKFTFDQYSSEISQICRKYGIKSLTAFGGVLSDEFNENSDIDFLLELDSAGNGLVRYMNAKRELEKLFQRPVDLVMPKTIKNERLKRYVYAKTRTVYAA